MNLMFPNQGASLFQLVARSIFEKCSEALRNAPALQTMVIAAAPGVMMFMGGAAMDSMHNIDIMTEGGSRVTAAGAAAFKQYMANAESLPLVEAIKHGLTGGYESLGKNIAMAGLGVAPGLPALALIAKAASHIEQFVQDRFGIGKEREQAQAADFSPAPR